MDNQPKVGLAILIFKDNKVLLGKRKNAHGAGAWCPPGGHLEFQESWENGACREIGEEVGIRVKNLRFLTATNDIFPIEQKHYVSIYMAADYDSGELVNMEPEKCERWEWFDWDNLPKPLFITLQNFLKTGFRP